VPKTEEDKDVIEEFVMMIEEMQMTTNRQQQRDT
jgi:hypothetical protein